MDDDLFDSYEADLVDVDEWGHGAAAYDGSMPDDCSGPDDLFSGPITARPRS